LLAGTGCDADAADVAQATWLKLLDQLDYLRDPARAGARLATTAQRECLAILRHSPRNLLCAETPLEQESTDSPDGELLTAQRDEALWRAFSQLPKSDQALLRMLMADPRPHARRYRPRSRCPSEASVRLAPARSGV
jgi:DNA-directed RNA polymerase specialized sigma24 family protein